MSVVSFLEAHEDRADIDAAQIDAAFGELMEGAVAHEDVKRFLEASAAYMTAPGFIAAGARALRARMIAVAAPEGAIDVCGTGGDGAHTLNVSSAVAFVVAGAGAPVAKHGNRAMSSKSGAADVLEALGVKLTGDVATLERALGEANIAFLFAQNHHPAMRHVAAARRELGKRTVFNLLGPLSNPAGVRRQLLGVFNADYIAPVAAALGELGAERAWVMHGAGGLDELSAEGENAVCEIERGKPPRRFALSAADAFLSHAANEAIKGGDAAHNAAALRALLTGELNGSAYHEIVQLNAGAALVVAGKAKTIADGAQLAFESIESGAAKAALDKLVAITQGAP